MQVETVETAGRTTQRVVKWCGCGRGHTLTGWQALTLVQSHLECEDDDGTVYFVELRNCDCGSTIALPVPAPKGGAR